MKSFRTVLLLVLLVGSASAEAQSSGRKPLTQADYDIWRSIQGATLSDDGQWAMYTVQPLVGAGELVVRSTRGTTEFRHTRGYTGRPTSGAGESGGPGEEGAGGGAPTNAASFSADGRFVVFTIQPSKEEFDAARKAGRNAQQPRNSMGIMSLADGKVTVIPKVRTFRLTPETGRHVSYMIYPDSTPAARGATARDSARAEAPAVAAGTPGGRARPVSADSTGQRTPRKTYGATMVLRELATGSESRVEDVISTDFNEKGTWLAYAVSSRTPANDGVYLRSLTNGTVTPVMTGLGNYRQVAFDRTGDQLVFVSDRDEYASRNPRFTLYYATARAPKAVALLTSDAVGPASNVADRGSLAFTRDGSAITVPLAPPALDSIPADSLADKAVYDLWHWREPQLQTQQRISAGRDRNRTYTAVYHLAQRKLVQLTNDSIPSVTLSDNGKLGLSSTSVPYAVEAMWGEGGTDVYLVDAVAGTRKRIRTRARGGAALSPTARYVTWFEDGRWNAYAVASGKTVDLTGALKVRFDQETYDTPNTPPAWGIAGWTSNDASVLVYDRYDIWELDPAGVRAPRVVTDSVGRRTRMVFRVVDLDRDDRWIDPSKPLLLRAVDDSTKASGFWQDRVSGTAAPAKIVMLDKALGTPTKARKAEQYLVTQSTFVEFPDLWTGTKLDQLTRISDANPQQKDYRWGSVEIVSWRDADGHPVRGLLYKPEDFDPSRKYPMVVYFYEEHTAGLHGYITPTGRNVINAPVYASKGYLVFMPDIHYTEGFPGPSALKTIVPGVQALVAKGFVKEDGIGIQGQSWGGYQTAYIITQTNLFKAAMAGAPVANMTSAYGGIRWESGNSRSGQYEHGQSRIGGSPWEFPTRYIENSPLFYADRIATPLFIMHNDADGAVPWYQGIEMFIAMRRLGKEAYLINYNGDAHNPRRRANQRDMDIKMQQFFDHHLVGAPMPDWMKQGIPFLMKGRDQIAPATTAAPTPTIPSEAPPR
jgi:dienelactone hydrolase